MNASYTQSASLTRFRIAVAMMWLTLPTNAIFYAMSWKHLPPRLATHFDFNSQPNGWMSREGSLIFSLLFASIVVTTATWVLSRVRKPDATAWALLALFYVIAGTLLWAENSLIAYNTVARRVNVAPVLAAGIGAAIAVVVIAFATGRGTALQQTSAIAKETHASMTFSLVLLVPAVAMAVIASTVAMLGIRIAIGIAAFLMFAGAAMAWNGFHYSFSPSGVEIRTLGFRLRSIPASEIQSYVVDGWNALGGYGIRGIGEKRAYVWGNSGVRIRLTDGEVFLGHAEPGRIIHALDLITNHKRQEGTERT